MKQKISILLAVLLLMSFFVGCRRENTEDKTQEELQQQQTTSNETEELDPEIVPETEENTQNKEDPILTKVAMGEEISCDLDGDGIEETICCSFSQKEDYMQQLSVVINGIESGYSEMRQWDNIQNYYYIVDLYTNDNFKEISILDAGPSNDPISVFFYYHDTMLEECGAVAGFVGEDQVTIHGDSTITAMKRLKVLQTWWGWTSWVVNENHYLQELPQKLYEPTPESHVNMTLLCDLNVYTQMDINSDLQLLTKETEIILTCTDNENWVGILADNTQYWLYLSDGWNIDTGSGFMQPIDVMNGLFWAD